MRLSVFFRPWGAHRTGADSRGFTLIELLTTLVIVGLVAGAVAAAFSSSIRVRRAMRVELDQLAEVQTLARLAREDLTHLARVPHAMAIDGESLVLLRTAASVYDETTERGGDLVLVRYRRDPTLGGSAPLLREVLDLDPRSLRNWSEESLGRGASSLLRTAVAGDRATPVFRLACPVEWEALEYENGEWHASDGTKPSAVRAIDLHLGAEAVGSPTDPDRSIAARDCRAWTIRIPLPMPPSEKASS